MPQVFVFSGHMADAPGRAEPRLPAAALPAAAERIGAALDALGARPGDLALTQGASGGDILFAEAALARGLRLALRLPLPRPDFVARSILPAEDGAGWLDRFEAVERRLAPGRPLDAEAALGPLPAGADPFVRGNEWLLDEALDAAAAAGAGRRRRAEAKVHFVCLWDGRDGDGPGGTGHMADEVSRRGGSVTRIDAMALPRGLPPAPARCSNRPLAARPKAAKETTMATKSTKSTSPAKKATEPAKPTKPTKAKAMALHIGLNSVSAVAYNGWEGPLAACEFDAIDMAGIARAGGMKPTLLLTKKATRAAVLAGIRAAAGRLGTGDLFFLTYSGHGGQVPDVTGDEPDKKDETWCLFDGQLIDDELYFELSRFRRGVRILVLSDSCHSGTVTRAAPPLPSALADPTQRPKLMPAAVAMRVYREHQAFYDRLQEDVARRAGEPVADPDTALAQVAASGRLAAIVGRFQPKAILVSGCQDNQTSMDGEHNGAFTEQLLRVWNDGRFDGNYGRFHAEIRAGLPPSQSPNLFALGPAASFLKERPFRL